MMLPSDAIMVHSAFPQNEEGILKCLAAAYDPYRADYSPEAFADKILNRATLRNQIDDFRVWVAVRGERVVGTITCIELGGDPPDPHEYPVGSYIAEPREGHIIEMAVLPEEQGSTVAAFLLQMAEQRLKIESCTWISVNVAEHLVRAQHFFPKHGYIASGQVRDVSGMRLIEYVKNF